MANKYTKRHLKTDSFELLKAECNKVGLVNNEGEIITASHNHHLNVIGTKYEPTGVMLPDGEGGEYPETVALEGCYAELKYKVDVGLDHLAYTCPECADEFMENELQAINAAHDIKVNRLVDDYNRAVTYDGSSETEKVNAIRAELNDAKSQYESDVEQLAIKYYG